MSARRVVAQLLILAPLLLLLAGCGNDGTPTSWQDVALSATVWGAIAIIVIGCAWADRKR